MIIRILKLQIFFCMSQVLEIMWMLIHICHLSLNFGCDCAASAGLGLLQFCNLNSFRSKFIIGFSLFMGLSVPQYFHDYLLTSGHGPLHTHQIWVSLLIFNYLQNFLAVTDVWLQKIVSYKYMTGY